MDQPVELRNCDLNELLGEIRRRQIDPGVLYRQLNLVDPESRDVRRNDRFVALLVLAFLSVVCLSVISWLAIDQSEIPDLLSGLAGSCIGAIAGILTGGGQDSRDQGLSRPN